MFNLFKKKNTGVDLHNYEAAYAGTPCVILDAKNLLLVLVRNDGILVTRENMDVPGHDTGDYGLFSSTEEIIAHFGIVDTAAQARILEIVNAGEF